MDLSQLLRDKRVLWGGAGVAALAGLWVFYRRSKGGAGGAGASSDTGASVGSAGQLGGTFPDTSGTNLANYLSQYSESIDRQMAEYQRTLQATIDSLHQAPPSSGPVTRRPVPRRPGPQLPGHPVPMPLPLPLPRRA